MEIYLLVKIADPIPSVISEWDQKSYTSRLGTKPARLTQRTRETVSPSRRHRCPEIGADFHEHVTSLPSKAADRAYVNDYYSHLAGQILLTTRRCTEQRMMVGKACPTSMADRRLHRWANRRKIAWCWW